MFLILLFCIGTWLMFQESMVKHINRVHATLFGGAADDDDVTNDSDGLRAAANFAPSTTTTKTTNTTIDGNERNETLENILYHQRPHSEFYDDRTHRCIHGELLRKHKFKPIIVNVSYGDNGRRKRDEQIFSPIRVFFDLTYVNDAKSCKFVGDMKQDQEGGDYKCQAPDVMTKDKGDILVQLVQLALTRITSTFAVVPTIEPLKVYPEGEDQACGQVNGVPIPTIYKSTGRDKTDLVIFVTTRPVTQGVRAFAQACAWDAIRRPVAGLLNFSPAKLLDTSSLQVNTMIHELMHVLGMSSGQYMSYIDPKTGAVYGNFPFRETKLVNQKSTYLISTPKAVARAREHFNCTLLTGIELEVATIDNK